MQESSSFESSSRLHLTVQSLNYLKEIAKWGNFLSIVGFISTGIIILMAFIVFIGGFSIPSMQGNPMGSWFGIIMGLIYVIVAAIYFFPCLYLYKSSNSFKEALLTNNDSSLEEAFMNHKSLFKFMAYFTIITIALYGIFIVIGIATALISGLF